MNMRSMLFAAAAALAGAPWTPAARASDHLDTPAVIADPRTDIGDVYAWTSPDGRQLNLVMTIVGHSFSSKTDYIFHVDSGRRYGETKATTEIACRFSEMTAADCRVGTADRIVGDPSGVAGLQGRNGRARLFAGPRDDPFFNNVKGSRDAFNYAAAQLRAGVPLDGAGCPQFSKEQAAEILARWRHTNGGPAQDFLAGWTPSAIVIAVDLDVVSAGGKMLAVWAETATGGQRIDRAARPLTGNALLAPLAPDEVSDKLKEQYNRATPATSAPFVAEIEKSLALYDGYDGICGNQLAANNSAAPAGRYHQLALMLADDRLWVNAAASTCTRLFAVEMGLDADCGGRSPNYDAANAFRSLLANGTTTGIDDGLHEDAHPPSSSVFPFLSAPEGQYHAQQ